MDWRFWRIVRAQLGTLYEVKRIWTLEDLVEAHELLDALEEAEGVMAAE